MTALLAALAAINEPEFVVQLTTCISEDEPCLLVGSASYIKYDGNYGVLTAKHIVDTGWDLYACFSDKQCVHLEPDHWRKGETEHVLLGVDAQKDWAFQPIEKLDGLKPGHLAKQSPKLGDLVAMYGYPWQEYRLEYGWVAKAREDNMIQLGLTIGPGASGAPILDRKGNIVCLVSGYTTVMLTTPEDIYNQTRCTVPHLEP